MLERIKLLPHQIAWMKRAYAFFTQMQEENRSFTVKDIMQNTGYSDSAIKNYIKNKWWWFLHENCNKTFRCEGLDCSEEEFIRLHRSPPVRPEESESDQEVNDVSEKIEPERITLTDQIPAQPLPSESIQEPVIEQVPLVTLKAAKGYIASQTDVEEMIELLKDGVCRAVKLGMPMAAVFNEIEGRPY